VKVFLLPLDGGRRVFYAEGRDAAPAQEAAAPKGGLRGWLERMSHRGGAAGPDAGKGNGDAAVDEALNASWNEAGPEAPTGGVVGRLRQAWDWLHRRLAPDEAMLKRLGRATRIKLYHPASMDSSEIQRTWREYLARRRRRHWFWLVVTLLVAPLTVVLTVVPGPNVIGYWFVYRAVCHLRVVLGTRRALGDRVATSVHPTPALEPAPGLAEGRWVARIARRFRLRGLGEFLDRVAAEPEAALPAAGTAVGAAAGGEPALPASRETR
jgi:Mitochondrial K+-H+ exchange-related